MSWAFGALVFGLWVWLLCAIIIGVLDGTIKF